MYKNCRATLFKFDVYEIILSAINIYYFYITIFEGILLIF